MGRQLGYSFFSQIAGFLTQIASEGFSPPPPHACRQASLLCPNWPASCSASAYAGKPNSLPFHMVDDPCAAPLRGKNPPLPDCEYSYCLAVASTCRRAPTAEPERSIEVRGRRGRVESQLGGHTPCPSLPSRVPMVQRWGGITPEQLPDDLWVPHPHY